MVLIAAVDEEWGIGKDGKLLFSIPEDQKYFRDTTYGKMVVMGRKTLESLPGGKPLKGRGNIVLTSHDGSDLPEGLAVAHSSDELCSLISAYDPDDVFLIGGATLYREFLADCSRALITKVQGAYGADASIDDLDKMEGWELVKEGECKKYGPYRYRFCEYEHTS